MFDRAVGVDRGVGVIEHGVRWLVQFQGLAGPERAMPGLLSAFPRASSVVVRSPGQDGHVAAARYDGHANWYDATFGFLGAETGSGGLLGRLLGSADPDGLVCLDIGCGTGLYFRAVQGTGYTVIGVDVSADQLRVARVLEDFQPATWPEPEDESSSGGGWARPLGGCRGSAAR